MGKCCSKNRVDLPTKTIPGILSLEPSYSAKSNENEFNHNRKKYQVPNQNKPSHQPKLSQEDGIAPSQAEHRKYPIEYPQNSQSYSLENCFEINEEGNKNVIEQEQIKKSQERSSEEVIKNEGASTKYYLKNQNEKKERKSVDCAFISNDVIKTKFMEEIQGVKIIITSLIQRKEKTYQYIIENFADDKIQGYYQSIKIFVPLEKVEEIIQILNTLFMNQTQAEEDMNTLMCNIEQNMCEDQLKIPMSLNQKVLIFQAFSAFLTRLVSLTKRAFNQNHDLERDQQIFDFFSEIKTSFKTIEKASGEDLILKCSHIINVSRGLIDPTVTVLELLPYIENLPTWLNNKVKTKSKEIDVAYNLFKTHILTSNTFKDGLEKVLRLYYNNLDHLDNYMKTYENMDIHLANYSEWIGMVGIGNRIYININIIRAQRFENCRTSLLIFLYIHEGFHLAYRKCENNFLSITPECKTDENTALFEGGRRIEYYLFGYPDINPCDEINAKIIIDKEKWKSGEPLFNGIREPAKLPCPRLFMSGMFNGFPCESHMMQQRINILFYLLR